MNFAKHAEIFLRDVPTLSQKLNLLMNHNVDLDSILKSPTTFKLSLKTIKSKLKKLKLQQIEPVSSLMLTYRPTQLDAYVLIKLLRKSLWLTWLETTFFLFNRINSRHIKEKTILDGSSDVVEYIAKRLGWDEQTKESALKSHPSLSKCNIFKVWLLFHYLFDWISFIHSLFCFTDRKSSKFPIKRDEFLQKWYFFICESVCVQSRWTENTIKWVGNDWFFTATTVYDLFRAKKILANGWKALSKA